MLKEERYEPGIALLLKITEKMPALTAAHIDLRHRHMRGTRRPGPLRGQPEQGAAIGSKTACHV